MRERAMLQLQRGLPCGRSLQHGDTQVRPRAMHGRTGARRLRRRQVLLGYGYVQHGVVLHRRRLRLGLVLHRRKLQAVLQEQQRLPRRRVLQPHDAPVFLELVQLFERLAMWRREVLHERRRLRGWALLREHCGLPRRSGLQRGDAKVRERGMHVKRTVPERAVLQRRHVRDVLDFDAAMPGSRRLPCGPVLRRRAVRRVPLHEAGGVRCGDRVLRLVNESGANP